MQWLSGAWAVFHKDLKLELRSRYAINTLLLFALSSLLLIRFTSNLEAADTRIQAALLWIVVLFSAAVGLGRVFISEEERGTVLLLQLNTRGSMVLAGKLLFNFALTAVLTLLTVAAFLLLLDVTVRSNAVFWLILLLGGLGLSGAMTLIAAIIARTANQGPLLAVLSFPVLVPLLLTSVRATEAAMEGTTWAAMNSEVFTLVAYAGAVITASFLLFDFVWTD